jgi:hypothetical protein
MGASSSHSAERREFFATVSCVLACFLFAASLYALASVSGQKSKETEKKAKDRPMRWDPPDVDKPMQSLAVAPACVLSEVLQQAGGRAKEMEDNLPNFTADETIQYESIGQFGDLPDYGIGEFEYLAVVTNTRSGPSIQESRSPTKGTQPFPASARDRGLPQMALIFLPKLQSDYDMKCDGATKWNDEPTWVIHFRQRADAASHTFSYGDGYGGVYAAKLKGRAWISADSGEVVHLETALMEGIPGIHVRNAWFSIDYRPVQFHSRNVRMWLPQTVDAYTQFDHRRTIIYHRFENFMLFSVQTRQEIKKPGEPQ